MLPAYREEAAQRLQDRLERLVRQPPSRCRSTRRTSSGSSTLASFRPLKNSSTTARSANRSRTITTGKTSWFFPAVPDALPDGITTDVVNAARTGGVVPGCRPLDFSNLSEDARAAVADALNGWRLLGLPRSRDATTSAYVRNCSRRCAWPGSSSTRRRRSAGSSNVQKGRDRRFIELTNVSWNGNPIVPQFGSKLGGRLRVLLCWAQPAEIC